MSSERAEGHTQADDEQEGPGSTAPGPSPLIGELMSEVRAYQRATDDLDEAAARHLGVNRNDGKCLDVLEEREPMTAGALAEELGLTTGAITTLLDRLEQAGYVRRVRDTADRRRVLVELTPLARERIAELYGPMGELGGPWFESHSDENVRLLIDFFRHSTKITAGNAARIRRVEPG